MRRNAVLATVFGLLLFLGKHAIAADPALAQKWVAYGQQLFASQKYDDALKAFSTAARADPRNAAAYKGIGNAYYYKKDTANALKYYKYAYQLNPQDAALGSFITKLSASAGAGGAAGGSPADMAARYYQAKRYDEAIQYYNQALASNPNDAKSWQMLGNCYYAKKDNDKAVEAYKKSLQLNPSNTSLQNFVNSIPSSGGGGGTQVADGPKQWGQALWRSAVLPGWGQAYNGQSGKGWLLGGVTLGLFAGTVGTYIVGDAARVQYMELKDPTANFDGPYGTWESMANLNHIFYIGFGVAYTFTLVDAIISAKPAPRTRADFFQEPPNMQVSLLEGGAGVKYKLLAF